MQNVIYLAQIVVSILLALAILTQVKGGGFGRVCTIQRTLPKAYFISDENLGEGDANDRVLFYIMRSIAQRKNQNKILWNEVQKDVMDSYARLNADYPSGMVFPHEESLLLNQFIVSVTQD